MTLNDIGRWDARGHFFRRKIHTCVYVRVAGTAWPTAIKFGMAIHVGRGVFLGRQPSRCILHKCVARFVSDSWASCTCVQRWWHAELQLHNIMVVRATGQLHWWTARTLLSISRLQRHRSVDCRLRRVHGAMRLMAARSSRPRRPRRPRTSSQAVHSLSSCH